MSAREANDLRREFDAIASIEAQYRNSGRGMNQTERAYLDQWPMTEAQKQSVLARDWNGMIALGGNIPGGYAKMGAVVSLIYVVGMLVIWLAPETKGKPLPRWAPGE